MISPWKMLGRWQAHRFLRRIGVDVMDENDPWRNKHHQREPKMTVRELIIELGKVLPDMPVGVMVTSDPDLNDFMSDITQVVVKDHRALIVGEP